MYVGGGHNPHVRVLHLVGAHLPVFPALEHAQQQGLGFRREFRNLIQEEGPPVGLFKIALPGVYGAGKGAFHVAEEFRVHQFFGQGAAVDHEERGLAAGAVLMDDAGHVLLAHAAFSLNEDTQAGGGKLHGRLQRFVECRVVADDVVFVF